MSAATEAGKAPPVFTRADLATFARRLDEHIDKFEDEHDEVIQMIDPFLEKGKIIIPPGDEASGRNLVSIINDTGLKVPGHSLRAGVNLDLPMRAEISIKFQTERDVRTLCVDPKKGLARKNGWDVDESEIHYLHHTEDKTNPRCKYAKLAVSEKVIGFIQAQMGLVFIGGSQGTVQWKGKDLVPDLEVELRPQ